MERAEQDWHDMSIMEQIQATDPDHDEELLVEFIRWWEKHGMRGDGNLIAKTTHARVLYAVKRWLDEARMENWVENKHSELVENQYGEVF